MIERVVAAAEWLRGLVRGQPPGKHLPYFKVLEAFERTHLCALCDLEAEGQRRYFDGLLYENVNDPGVRQELRRTRGYCGRHARMLLGFQDATGVAILYRDQVELFLEFLTAEEARTRSPRRSRKFVPADWRPGDPCPACSYQETVRADAISTLLDWLHDLDLRAALEGSPGPCVPHFVALLAACADEPGRRFLLALQRIRATKLAHDLDEFRRKSGHDGSREAFGPEGDAWQRAVAFMTGASQG